MPEKLSNLPKTLRHFLAAFLLLLSIATSVGLIFINETTAIAPEGISEHYNGSDISGDEFDIPESYPKSVKEMLLNTHNHLFGFAFIFLSVGILFFFNSIISGFWKYLLMVEPFFSVILTFGGLWLLRFANPMFVYLVIIFAILTYLSFFLMVFVLLYELLIKKEKIST